MLSTTLKSKADEHAYAADVCKNMDDFKQLYRMQFDKRKLKRRFDLYVVTKRTERKKLAIKQLAKIKSITSKTSDWTTYSTTFFTKDYNTAHNSTDESQARELFCEDFDASDVYNNVEEAQEHILFYRSICQLALHIEERTKDAMEAMIFDEPYFPSRVAPSSRSKPCAQKAKKN
jgi:hypothetical protein